MSPTSHPLLTMGISLLGRMGESRHKGDGNDGDLDELRELPNQVPRSLWKKEEGWGRSPHACTIERRWGAELSNSLWGIFVIFLPSSLLRDCFCHSSISSRIHFMVLAFIPEFNCLRLLLVGC